MMMEIEVQTSSYEGVNEFSSTIDEFENGDCRFLLRTLERQAFESIVNALRAQGPLTEYKEALLTHLKSALFIDDEECNFRIRMALNHPCLSKIAQELNPSYDIFSDWSSLVYRNSNSELSGLQPTSKRKPSYNKRFIGITNTISSAIRRYNGIPSSSQEKLFRLLHLPRRPYVPEKLRSFLHQSEHLGYRIDVSKEAKKANFSQNKEFGAETDIYKRQDEGGKRKVGRPPKYRKNLNDMELIKNSVPDKKYQNNVSSNSGETLKPNTQEIHPGKSIVNRSIPARNNPITIEEAEQAFKESLKNCMNSDPGSTIPTDAFLFDYGQNIQKKTREVVEDGAFCQSNIFVNDNMPQIVLRSNKICKGPDATNCNLTSRKKTPYFTRKTDSLYTTISNNPDLPTAENKRLRTFSYSEGTSTMRTRRYREFFECMDTANSSFPYSASLEMDINAANEISSTNLGNKQNCINFNEDRFLNSPYGLSHQPKELLMNGLCQPYVKCSSETKIPNGFIKHPDTLYPSAVTSTEKSIFFDENVPSTSEQAAIFSNIECQIIDDDNPLVENDEEKSALDFLASTASLLLPIQAEKIDDMDIINVTVDELEEAQNNYVKNNSHLDLLNNQKTMRYPTEICRSSNVSTRTRNEKNSAQENQNVLTHYSTANNVEIEVNHYCDSAYQNHLIDKKEDISKNDDKNRHMSEATNCKLVIKPKRGRPRKYIRN